MDHPAPNSPTTCPREKAHWGRDRRAGSAAGTKSIGTRDTNGCNQHVSSRHFVVSAARLSDNKGCTYAMAGCQPNLASYCTWAIAVRETGSAGVLPRVATCAVCIRRSNASKNKGRFPCRLAALAGPLYLWLLCTRYTRAAVPDLSSSSSFPFFFGVSPSCAILRKWSELQQLAFRRRDGFWPASQNSKECGQCFFGPCRLVLTREKKTGGFLFSRFSASAGRASLAKTIPEPKQRPPSGRPGSGACVYRYKHEARRKIPPW